MIHLKTTIADKSSEKYDLSRFSPSVCPHKFQGIHVPSGKEKELKTTFFALY